MSPVHKICIPNASRKESHEARVSRGFQFVQVLLWCFPAQPITLPEPALSSCPRPGLLWLLECLTSRRDSGFSWDTEPWLTWAIAGSVTGWTLVSPKPVQLLLHVTRWARVESIFLSCCFATWSLAPSNGVQDLPFYFCCSLKDPILFSFSSNFYKNVSWEQPFCSRYNPSKAHTLYCQNLPHLWGLSGPLCASESTLSAYRKAHGGAGIRPACILHTSAALSRRILPPTCRHHCECVEGLPKPFGKPCMHLASPLSFLAWGQVFSGTFPWGALWHEAEVLRRKTLHKLL